MYTVQAPNDVIALDAATGRIFWTYSYNPGRAHPCCGRVNRGLAILGDTLFMGTIDAHLVAIDAKNGRPLWNTTVARAKSGYAITHALLVLKDKVIIGTAGGEYGIRGLIAAYDVHTGREQWRTLRELPGPRSRLTGHQLRIFGKRKRATERSWRSNRTLVKRNGNSKCPTSLNQES